MNSVPIIRPSSSAFGVVTLALTCTVIGSAHAADPPAQATCAVATSRFWKQLDAVCATAGNLRTAVPSMPEP
jgi:hypothetical protein